MSAVFERPRILPNIFLRRQLTPIAVFVPQEKLRGHLASGAHREISAGGSSPSASARTCQGGGAPARGWGASLENSKAARAGIALIGLTGAVVSGQEFSIARPPWFAFKCRHKTMRHSAAMDSFALCVVYVRRLPGR
jgi:hypothetical protein